MNNSLLRSFQELKGRPPTEAETAKFLKTQKVLNLGDNDALWLVLFALDDVNPAAPKRSFFPVASSACLGMAVGLIAGFILSQKVAPVPTPPMDFSANQKAELRETVQDAVDSGFRKGKAVTIRVGDRVFNATKFGELPPDDTSAKPETPKIEN